MGGENGLDGFALGFDHRLEGRLLVVELIDGLLHLLYPPLLALQVSTATMRASTR